MGYGNHYCYRNGNGNGKGSHNRKGNNGNR